MLPEPLRGPAFSSYAPEEVGWLLQDLSDVTLEAPTEEREEAIQSGGAHYAESLPVEYQPSDAVPGAVPRRRCGTSAARHRPGRRHGHRDSCSRERVARAPSWSRWPAPAPPSAC